VGLFTRNWGKRQTGKGYFLRKNERNEEEEAKEKERSQKISEMGASALGVGVSFEKVVAAWAGKKKEEEG